MRRQRSFAILGTLLLTVTGLTAQTDLIVTGDSWSYLDTGGQPPTNWKEPSFDDGDWALGPSPLGYGEPGVVVTSLESDIATGYFRRRFDLAAAPANPARLRVLGDDGVVIYLNGNDVFRNNMPSGSVNYHTLALSSAAEGVYLETSIDPSFFRAGNNLIAAEVHQVSLSSSDLVFDLQLQDPGGPANPRVVITSPTNNATVRVGSDLTIKATAEPAAEILSVAFYEAELLLDEDFASPYEIVWQQVPEDSYILRAVATTAAGSFTSAPVQFRATLNARPSVTITSPPNNANLPPGNIRIEAAAADPDGSVTLVEFFVNGLKAGEDASEPYSMILSDAAPGDYSIEARATDNDGAFEMTSIFVRVQAGAGVVRGPYLQLGTPTSVIVKWRTDIAFDSLARYGLAPDNLNQSAYVGAITTEHEIPLTGLAPDTKYFYSIGSSLINQGSGPDYFFVTSPSGPKPTRVWVIGDSGTGSQAQRDVWVSYNSYTGSRYTDAWLMLGDNAYGSGTDFEYQRGMFNIYPELLRQTVVWPTIGNHDASPAYFDIFTLPRNGEAGGVATGVENYYSYDYGDIHFICLGGYYSGSRLSNGVMCTWLKADLEANTKKWLIAYWHQPPYTRGSHNSDFERDLIEMRENAVPILESYGVDLVLSGHSHCYERSYLLRGHYGHSSTLEPSMLLDDGSGRIDDTGAYVKETTGTAANQGTVYVVAGSSGHATFGSVDHPAMYIGYLRMGSLVLDIDGDTLQGTFLNQNGGIDDYFTLTKGDIVIRMVDLTLEEGTVTVSFTSTPGRRYQLEFSSNLAAGWTAVGDQIQAGGGTLSGAGHVPSTAQGFYRVVQLD